MFRFPSFTLFSDIQRAKCARAWTIAGGFLNVVVRIPIAELLEVLSKMNTSSAWSLGRYVGQALYFSHQIPRRALNLPLLR